VKGDYKKAVCDQHPQVSHAFRIASTHYRDQYSALLWIFITTYISIQG